jgi:hypothetical protein
MPDPILNDTGFTPNVESIPNQPLPSFETFSNPYADLTVTSQPKSAMVGIDSSNMGNRIEFAKQKALSDPYIQAQRFETPKIEGYEAAAGSKYFEQYGVVPGMDVEEFYGSVQTNWDKLSNAFVGAGVLAANQFKEQLLSWGDTASWIGSLGDNSPFKQNELEEINKWQNSFNNKYHIFQTQEDRNTFFNMSNFSNMLQQSGYAIGAVLEMAAEEAALSALTAFTFGAASEIQAARSLQLASKLGKTVERTRQLEKTLQGVNAIRKGFNSVIGNITNVPFIGNTLSFGSNFNKLRRIDQMTNASTALARTASRGFGAFYRDLRMINAGITEAKATVAPVMEDTYQALMDDYRTAYGLEPDNAKKEEFKNIAFNAVQAEGAKQAVWIALTDKIAFDGILKSFKGSKYLDDGLAAQGIFKNTKSAIAKGEDQFVSKKGYQSFIHQLKVSPVKALTKAPLTYLKTNLMEGVQESGQNIIDEYTKSWTLYNYGSPQQRKEVKDVNDFLLEGAKSQLTMEGTKTFMSGFLTGGILNVMSSGVRGARSLGNQYLNKESYADSKKREEAQKIDIVNTLNDIVNNKGDFYRSMLEANISRETSAKDGNLKEYWDNKNDFLNKYAIQLVKSNLHNVAIDRLQEITTELTPEEFKQAYPSALVDGVSVDEAKLKMNERYEEFKTKLNEVKETYDNIVNNYGNPYNPAKYKKDTPEYKKEVINYYAAQNAIEHISFSKQTYKDIAKRQKEVLNNIKTYIPNMSFTSLYAITSPSFTLEKELELLENEMNTTADEKIKKEKAEKIKLYNTYKKNVETLSEDINNATGNTEKLTALKDKFRTKNIDVITELLKTDNSNLTSDAVYNTASDIFDYLHLQSDNETALNNFNIVANPLTYNALHESHVNQIINMQEELEKMNKAAESAETKTAETAKSENVKYILVNDKKARVINAEVSEDGSATIITYVLDGDSIDNEKTVTARISEDGVKLYNDEDGNLISVEPFVEEVTTSGVFTPTTSYGTPTGPELTTASGTSTESKLSLEQRKEKLKKSNPEFFNENGNISIADMNNDTFIKFMSGVIFDLKNEIGSESPYTVIRSLVEGLGLNLQPQASSLLLAASEETKNYLKEIYEFYKNSTPSNYYQSEIESLIEKNGVKKLMDGINKINEINKTFKAIDNLSPDEYLKIKLGFSFLHQFPNQERFYTDFKFNPETNQTLFRIPSKQVLDDFKKIAEIYKESNLPNYSKIKEDFLKLENFKNLSEEELIDLYNSKNLSLNKFNTQSDNKLGALEKMNLDAERNTLNEIINNPKSTAKQISDAKNRLEIVNKELGITSTADVAGIKSIEDYDQDELFIKSNKLTEEANRQLEEKNQVGPKQVAPAYSIANTTDLYDVITLNNGKKVYQRKSINPNYVFELATQTILPGYSIYYKVITDYSIPYEDKINYAYEKSDIFDQDDKVKSDMYDNARIGIYAKINGKEQLIGSVHTPTWISLKLDDEFRNIAIPQDQINDVLPEVVKQEIENNQTLRKVILDSFNKDPNFIVSGNIESKSIGILKIENKTNKLSDVVNPKLAEGGLNNRHGMFGIVRNGTLQVDYNIESDKIEMSNNFKKNIENYEGSSFLLVPTGTGTYFPVFIKLPKLDNGQSSFILESWKAFTGIENNKELVNAVYKSLGKEEPQGKPDIEILKQYINQYLTMLNSDPLSKIGNGQDVPIGAARLNITSEGTLYLQVNNKDGYFKGRYDKSNLPPSNILELMGNLSTTIKFTNPMNKNILGINNTLPFDMLSMKDGKLLIEKMTYNQYIMSRVGTHLEKGTNSKNEFNDWVYFANPVIKVNYTEPVFEEPAVSNEVNKEEIEGILNTAPAELTNNADDIFSELDRALGVDSMTDAEVQKNSKKCTGILPDA